LVVINMKKRMYERMKEPWEVISRDEIDPFLPSDFASYVEALNNRCLEIIFHEIDRKVLARALKPEDDEIQNKIFNNMSKRALAMLMEDMKYIGTVSQEDAHKAQEEFISVIRHFEDTGEIIFVINTEEPAQTEIPKIGFFWWNRIKDENDKEKYVLIYAESFNIGDVMSVDHYTIWEREKALGKVTGDHRDNPRGRVQWNPGLCQIEVLAGECNLSEELQLLIKAEFNLWDATIEWKYNAHYDMDNMSDSLLGDEEFD